MRPGPVVFALILLLTTPALCSARQITKDETWSGVVKVDDRVVVEQGVKLRILSGTRVTFAKGKPDDEGFPDTGILVDGTIEAKGTPEARIVFTSAEDAPAGGDWGEIKLIASPGSAFTNCDFTYATWGLHLHDSALKVSGCTFTRNSAGGIRGLGGAIEITRCTITGLDTGIRYWRSNPKIHHNTITGNGTGIFMRDDADGSYIKYNNIYDNTEYNLKLGDGQKNDVDARLNWWGSKDLKVIKAKIFDKKRDKFVGKVTIQPILKDKVPQQ
jgi:hypothetical protein